MSLVLGRKATCWGYFPTSTFEEWDATLSNSLSGPMFLHHVSRELHVWFCSVMVGEFVWPWVFVQIGKSGGLKSLNRSFTDACLFSRFFHQSYERERER